MGQITQPATTGMVAPQASGNGSPVGLLTCNTVSANLLYIQKDSTNGRLWTCDDNGSGLAWRQLVNTIPLGSYITQTGLNAAMTTQTICDTGSACPAGFYTLYVYVNVSTAGTLVSAVTSNIQFTDSVRTYSMAMGGSLSLVATTPAQYVFSFYHAANTAVTVTTSTTTLTGAPVYNFYARLVLQGS